MFNIRFSWDSTMNGGSFRVNFLPFGSRSERLLLLLFKIKSAIIISIINKDLLYNKEADDMTEDNRTVEEKAVEGNDVGTVKIANDVVATIAGLAAMEIEGVAGMSGGIVGGIAEMLGRKNLTKGVKVDVSEKETVIDVFIIVEYGFPIPKVARGVQTSVQAAVENMTGLKPLLVNIHVQGVNFPQSQPETVKGSEE